MTTTNCVMSRASQDIAAFRIRMLTRGDLSALTLVAEIKLSDFASVVVDCVPDREVVRSDDVTPALGFT
jgi:hypothetical protein